MRRAASGRSLVRGPSRYVELPASPPRVATWHSGRRRLQHFESTLLPLSRDRARAVMTAYSSGRGDLRAALDALRDEVDLQREFVALEGDVTRAWAFLHLLHSAGATP